MRKVFLPLAAGLAFLINPSLGCGPSGFQFGESEMHGAVDGRWRIGWSLPDGSSSSVSLDIAGGAASMDGGLASTRDLREGSGFVRPAAACESRTFILRSAAACMDDTRMSLRVNYVEGDSVYESGPTEAEFWVSGLQFKTGLLRLVFGDTTAEILVDSDGAVEWARGSLRGISTSEVTVTADHLSL